jgi:hypothetical protein
MPAKRFQVVLTHDEMIQAVVDYIQRTKGIPFWFHGSVTYSHTPMGDRGVKFTFTKKDEEIER